MENPDDSSFGTSFSAALDSCHDAVAVHRVHQVPRGDVDVLLLVAGPTLSFFERLARTPVGRPPRGMLGHDESVTTRTRLQPTHDQIHLLGKSETVAADLQQHALADECLQLALEAAALLARHAKKLRELARVGGVMNLVANEIENVVAGVHVNRLVVRGWWLYQPLTSYKYDLEVADVCPRRARADQVAKLVEENVTVMFLEVALGRPDIGCFRSREGRAVNNRAGGIGWTIDAIGADAGGDNRCRNRVQSAGHGERAFLIASTFARP